MDGVGGFGTMLVVLVDSHDIRDDKTLVLDFRSISAPSDQDKLTCVLKRNHICAHAPRKQQRHTIFCSIKYKKHTLCMSTWAT